MKTQAARATGRTGEAPDTFQGLRPNSSNNITKIFRSGAFSRFFLQDVSRLFENLSFEPIQIGATTSGPQHVRHRDLGKAAFSDKRPVFQGIGQAVCEKERTPGVRDRFARTGQLALGEP